MIADARGHAAVQPAIGPVADRPVVNRPVVNRIAHHEAA
jgi:hypothetical protein